MEATVDLNDQLYRQVKIRAAERGVTVTSIFEAALARYLAEVGENSADQRRPGFELPLLNNGALLQELFDADRSVDKQR